MEGEGEAGVKMIQIGEGAGYFPGVVHVREQMDRRILTNYQPPLGRVGTLRRWGPVTCAVWDQRSGFFIKKNLQACRLFFKNFFNN